MAVRDVLIVGAGPAGLATAIAARQLGLDHQVVEQGSIVDAIYRYPTHMSFFTTPELLEIGGMPLVTPFEKPTRLEALRYYRRVAEAYQLQIALHERVTAVSNWLNSCTSFWVVMSNSVWVCSRAAGGLGTKNPPAW